MHLSAVPRATLLNPPFTPFHPRLIEVRNPRPLGRQDDGAVRASVPAHLRADFDKMEGLTTTAIVQLMGASIGLAEGAGAGT